ncbi:hypothetical protein HanRHA438_Chr15g0720791 [Helianthus annuus]|nr:hypothetical protein HanHA300_Chr15g0577711 [Helianthus annuus]KAJ0649798.1 hypothetical protein HanLR1_Chr15g0588361 [Helianthus annuus]KAJ0653580.1 hypothetical protein HanOQP8_Chr15g0585131 [Helianthus annuus]KAJ0846077.1 hypothetical protein HanRHA438_Chr15g0720791 [Helianthus annuus]
MYPNNPTPSLSPEMITNNPKASNVDQIPPVDVISVNQDGPLNNRGVGNSVGYGEDTVQAPSIGAMRPFVASQPSGDFDNNDGQQPPSFNDVAPRETSQTGSSSTEVQMSDAQVAGMSLTGSNFKKYGLY